MGPSRAVPLRGYRPRTLVDIKIILCFRLLHIAKHRVFADLSPLHPLEGREDI